MKINVRQLSLRPGWTRICRLSVYRERRFHSIPAEWRDIDPCRCINVRQRLQALEHTIEKRGGHGTDIELWKPIREAHLFEVLIGRQACLKCHEAVWLEAQVGALHPEKALDHKAGADEQHQREGNLSRYQSTLNPLAVATTARKRCCALHPSHQIVPCEMQYGRRAESQTGCKRYDEGESENSAINGDMID